MYNQIAIPGVLTTFDDQPTIQLSGGGREPVTVRVVYHAGPIGNNQPVGQITFKDVLEYRFIDDTVEYEEYERHVNDEVFGLIEITNSQYIETMLARSTMAIGPPGRRLADHIPDSSLHHYRLMFDDYGRLDVIALDFEVGEIVRK